MRRYSNVDTTSATRARDSQTRYNIENKDTTSATRPRNSRTRYCVSSTEKKENLSNAEDSHNAPVAIKVWNIFGNIGGM